jgi:RNA polymerase sigma-70 factor (ECF subfamily)
MKATLPEPKQTMRQISSQSDEDLLMAYREASDANLFHELVRRYERELYSYLRRYLGDAEMAEDAFQAAFFAGSPEMSVLRAGTGVPAVALYDCHQPGD